MADLTHDESVILDSKRLALVDRIMTSVGFELHRPTARDMTGPIQFTRSIDYTSKSGDWIEVKFPNEDQADQVRDITVCARFKNQIDSPEWGSLPEFENRIASWIEECRSQLKNLLML